MTTCRLPASVFDALEVPRYSHSNTGDSAFQLLFAERIIRMAALSFRRLSRPLDSEALIDQVMSTELFDELVIAVATESLSTKDWQLVDALTHSLGENAIPKAFQGRDKHICALILVLRDMPDNEDELGGLFKGFASVCRYDAQLYTTILGHISYERLQDIACQVIANLNLSSNKNKFPAEEGR
ncbi:hypothetical protein [Halomonas colorata]|uniref:hypothetical protein n=1 Tax=Halomonas colorata TaxID=2742615 RepID=UPI0018682105|nr:hypothetical protein [Halomonas colorata]